MGDQTQPVQVNVARLRAADRPAVVGAFVGKRVDVTAKWGIAADQRSAHTGEALALAAVYGEPGAYALVLLTDDERVLAIKMPRLLTVAPASAEPRRAD